MRVKLKPRISDTYASRRSFTAYSCVRPRSIVADYAGVHASGRRLEDAFLEAAQLPSVNLATPADFSNPEVSLREINARRMWTKFSLYMANIHQCKLVWPPNAPHVSFSSLLPVEMLGGLPRRCFNATALDQSSLEFDREARQLLGGMLYANATATLASIRARSQPFCELDDAHLDAWGGRFEQLTAMLPEDACHNSSIEYVPLFGEDLR